jgi:hypothetical protein
MLYQTKKLKSSKFLAKTIVFVGILSLFFPVSAKSKNKEVKAASSNPVITMVLGVGLRMFFKPTDAQIEHAAKDIAEAGFSLTWEASPSKWVTNILDDPKGSAHRRNVAAIFRKHGIGIAYGFFWHSVLPVRSKTNTHLFAEVLDPKTGTFGIAPFKKKKREKWNYGSEEALQEFARSTKMLFKQVGPIAMFYVDEEIFGSAGKKVRIHRPSAYWTSPTYSVESLKSFRQFLAREKYSGALEARFPVTTVAVKPGPKANMGLPAIKIGDANEDRLVEDNDWPNSKLWKHWYKWRTRLYSRWLDTVTTLAYEANKDNENWWGCLYEMPVQWMIPELGHDIQQIARLPHVDYIVAGYCTGERYAFVKKIAEAAGKKWGLQVEVSRYHMKDGMPVKYIEETFKNAVNDGASLVTCYAGKSFRTDMKNPPASYRKHGWYYMPEQAKAWKSCIAWLKQGRGLKKPHFAKSAGN